MQFDYNEADTCRRYITPALRDAGWETEPASITEQRTFTDGRILVTNGKSRRSDGKRADYILRYSRDYAIAVVEAKAYRESALVGLQQAKEYAEILKLRFAYATNGREIIEFDYTTGSQQELTEFPSPADLWTRLQRAEGITPAEQLHVLEPQKSQQGKPPRYYQEIAINLAVQAIAKGQRRVLLTMATGTGKTFVAFQICWKLWSSRWNKDGQYRKPRILYLADRNILVDQPKSGVFAPFGDALYKIEGGKTSTSREMYFAIYQALASRDGQPGLYQTYARDFFDLIIVDECHRGSAQDDSNWREILEYFHPAYQIGMTATPLRSDNADTYQYFGNPIYQYSLKQGIEDGFLAPYTVHRVVTNVDATGWRPTEGERDRFGRVIPDLEYTTEEFDRVIVLRARTDTIARHISDFLRKTGNRYAKTIVFCVDQEHAAEMAAALARHNADLMRQYPDWVCQVTANQGDIGLGHLSRFQDVETLTPSILTTSRLLTTGVDAPTVKNVVIARIVNSMTEFKQIIGRGTRVRDDYDKVFFNILDYTGSATRLFADSEFDGEPVEITETIIDGDKWLPDEVFPPEGDSVEDARPPKVGDDEWEPSKYYVDRGEVSIAAEVEYELDINGKRNVVSYTDYTAEQVRTLYPNSAVMRRAWADPQGRSQVIAALAERNIDFERLTEMTRQPDADPFDLLCHVAFNAPIRTRRERANRVKLEETAFFAQYTAQARDILMTMLEKYAEHGTGQLSLEVLRIPPLSTYGTVGEIAGIFGGAEKLRQAVEQLQTLLYVA